MLTHLSHAWGKISPLMRAPSACLVCGSWQSARLCLDCRHEYGAAPMRCRRCGLRLTDEALGPDCPRCEDYPPEMDRAIVGVDFEPPWSEQIGALKFQQQPAAAVSLARILAKAVRAQGMPAPDLIVPVPLSRARWQERGFNQAWVLAQLTSQELGWSQRLHPHTLERRIDTGRIMRMHADERARRIRQAFRVRPDALHRVEGQHVVLVDDVMTTGATANEATRTLLAAGAASVTGWFAARTPERRTTAPQRAETRPHRATPVARNAQQWGNHHTSR